MWLGFGLAIIERRGASYVFYSLVLHGAALSCTITSSRHKVVEQLQPIAINYSTKEPRKNTKKTQKNLNLKPKGSHRIGSPDYLRTKRPLGITLTAQHFLERLKAHIEPSWKTFLGRTEIAPVSCSTTLYIDADKYGTVLAINTVKNNCPERIKAAAIEAIKYCNLIPPPKILLAPNGIFELEWTFTIRK